MILQLNHPHNHHFVLISFKITYCLFVFWKKEKKKKTQQWITYTWIWPHWSIKSNKSWFCLAGSNAFQVKEAFKEKKGEENNYNNNNNIIINNNCGIIQQCNDSFLPCIVYNFIVYFYVLQKWQNTHPLSQKSSKILLNELVLQLLFQLLSSGFTQTEVLK